MSSGGARGLGRDGGVAIVILAVSLALLGYLFANPSEGVSQHVSPNTLPTLLAAVIALLSALMLLGSVRSGAGARPAAPASDDRTRAHDEPLFGPRALWLAAGMALYLVLLPWLGYLVSTGIFCAALARLFGERRPLAIALLAIVPVLCLYLFFVKFMIIPLPEARLLAHLEWPWSQAHAAAPLMARVLG